jgi:DNA-binding LacI/PurR family transcriptional regulator
MAKRPTQADVAKLAGVSRATVSYVLNDRLDGRIPITEQTREKVLKAAESLRYEPNAIARSLKAGASYMIAVLIPAVHNPHYWDILDGVSEVVSEHDYHLSLSVANLELEKERWCFKSLLERRFDGLILLPTFSDVLVEEVRMLSKRSSPAVFIAPMSEADYVYTDIRSGAEALMDHLIDQGHKRIGFIAGAARPQLSQTREDVYRESIREAGLPLDEDLVRHCGHTMANGYIETRLLLDLPDPPTAIWAINDILAMSAMRAIQERGLHIPNDVALAGFDDIVFARQLHPPLTTVHMPAKEMGRKAAEILFKRIDDPRCAPMQITLNTQLVIRQSTMVKHTVAIEEFSSA